MIEINTDAQRVAIAALEQAAESGAIRRTESPFEAGAIWFYEPTFEASARLATVTASGNLEWHARGHDGVPFSSSVRIGTSGPERLRLAIERYNAECEAATTATVGTITPPEIVAFRERHMLSQSGLADLLGIGSRLTVLRWEQDHTTPPVYLARALRDLEAHELAPKP